MTWYQILTLIGIPTLGSLLTTYLFNVFVSSKKRNKELINTITSENQLIKSALQAVLRDRLYECYDRIDDKQYVTIQEKENFRNLYTQYHALGANGVMDALYEEVMKMPISENKRHKKQ